MGRLSIYKYGSEDEILVQAVKYEYNGTAMGERYITFSISSAYPISWSIGDYLYLRGEKFTLNTIPSCKKQSRKGEYGEAFVYEGVKFDSIVRELSSKIFFDYVLDDNNAHYTSLGTFSFYVTDIKQFASRIQANLDRAYGKDDWLVEVVNPVDFVEQSVGISSGTTILAALNTLNTSFNQNFTVRMKSNCSVAQVGKSSSVVISEDNSKKVITIGNIEETVPGDVLVYGKLRGLKSIQKSFGSKDGVVTRLHAYGSTRNIPYRYYNKKYSEEIGESRYVSRLMLPKTVSLKYTNGDGVLDFGSATLWHSTGNKFDAYVESTNILFTMAGVSKNGELIVDENGNYTGAEIIEGEHIFDSDDGEYKEIYPSLEEMNIDDVPENTIMYEQNYSHNTSTLLQALESYIQKMDWVSTYGVTASDAYSGVTQIAKYDNDSKTWNTYDMAKEFLWGEKGFCPVTSRMGVGIYGIDKLKSYLDSLKMSSDMIPSEGVNTHELKNTEKTNIKNNTYLGQGRLDMVISNSNISDNGISNTGEYDSREDEKDISGVLMQKTFTINIPQIGFNVESFVEDSSPTISFKSGMCAGREFEISSCKLVDSSDYSKGWTLECVRKYDTDVNMMFPNSVYKIEAGNKFVLLGILMPDVYVAAAEVRLFKQAMKWLSKNDHPKKTFSPELDSIWMAKHANTSDAICEGVRLSFNDIDSKSNAHDLGLSGNGESITITNLTIKYNDEALPKYEVTLSDDDDNQSVLAKMASDIAKNASSTNTAIAKTAAKAQKDNETTQTAVAMSRGGGSDGTSAVLTQSGTDVNGDDFKWTGALTTEISVGNVAANKTFKVGTTLEEIIRKIFKKKVVYSHGYITLDVASEVEYGTASITITVNITKNQSGEMSNLRLTIAGNDYTMTETTAGSGKYTYTYRPSGGIKSNLSISVSCSFAKNDTYNVAAYNDTKTATVSVKYRWYAGWTTDDVDVSSISPTSLQSSGLIKGTEKITMKPNAAYWFYAAVPSTNGKPSWKDSLDSDYFNKSATVIGNVTLYGSVSYKYYAYHHEATCGDGQQSFTLTIT